MDRRQAMRILGLAALASGGCSPWIRSATTENVLPKPQLAPATVVLEIAFIHLTPDDQAIESATWRQLDEQILSLELRHTLAGHGLRVGLAGTELPAELRTLLERTSQELETAPAGDDVSTAEAASLSRQRRLQVRAGRRGKVVITPTLPQISVLSKDDQGHVKGESYRDAQCLFSLKASPQGDGRTQLQLTPEIEHGELKNRWVPLDGALIQQVGKDRVVFDHLRIDLPLAAGQSLVLGTTDAPSGLGQHYFSAQQPQPQRKLLLVRIAQTQQDDLFSKPNRVEELTSTE